MYNSHVHTVYVCIYSILCIVCIGLFVICFHVYCRLLYYTFLLLILVDIHMTGIGQLNSSTIVQVHVHVYIMLVCIIIIYCCSIIIIKTTCSL